MLKKRLAQIWQAPNFPQFFQRISSGPPRLIKKGTILFNDGEPLNKLYFIKDGFVKLYRLSDEGRETTIYLYGPGSILGIRALTSEDRCAKHFAEALTDLKLWTIQREDYLKLLAEHPEYILDLTHVFMQRLNYTERKLESMIAMSVLTRIAIFLEDVALRFANLENKPITLPLSLTHQRIAEFVGSVRETITMAIQKLEKERVLKVNRGQVLILDLEKLQKQAMFD